MAHEVANMEMGRSLGRKEKNKSTKRWWNGEHEMLGDQKRDPIRDGRKIL